MSIAREYHMKEWLKNIPQDWQIIPLNSVASITYGFPAESDLFTSDSSETPIIRIRDITSGVIETYYTGKYPKNSIVKSGDLLVGMDGDFNTRVWDGPESILNQRCCRITGSSVMDQDFIRFALPIALNILNELTLSTTVKHLLADGLENILLPLPSFTEQTKISRLLKSKVGKIERAIKLMTQQIEELEAYKKSLIYEAVTKGLDPTVSMKPSGIEWIGNIPEHWEVNRLRNLVMFESGATPSKDNPSYWNGDIPWVSSQEVKGDTVTATTYSISQAGVASCSTKILPKGTPVIVVRSGILQHTIPIALLGEPMAINQDIKALVPRGEVLEKFILYFVKGNNDNLLGALIKDKSTVDNISTESLKNLLVPLPSIAEQKRILAFLDNRCSTLYSSLVLKRDQLELLQKQRQSLIFEYVTGKRRVSEVA